MQSSASPWMQTARGLALRKDKQQIQWINRQILVLFTSNEEMILFDPKNMVMTQQTSVRNKQLIYHDWFNTPLKDLVIDAANLIIDSPENSSLLKSVEMAYFSAIKGYKGKLFLLGMKQIYFCC